MFQDSSLLISANKGVSFNFADNAKLKESGFAIDGKQVNGFATADGVTININSAKALNKVVGHEVTHVFEGSGQYDALMTAMKEFAAEKGIDWDARVQEMQERYKNVKNADPEKELLADLVGEYLFTDSGFVKSLSTKNPGLFKKIFEEIKYLAKTFAGTKQGAALEKVKKTFAELYRDADVKNTAQTDGVKYLLSKDIDGNVFVDVTEDIFDAADGESVARTIQRVIAERFNNIIDVHGQKIQINKITNDEFRRSNSSSGVQKYSAQAYTDKLKTIANADEILLAARNWIGEEIKHTRKDDIIEFARADVMYRVGENGYVADVLVGTRKNGAAVLYDIVNIYEKEITEAPVTMASDDGSQRRQDASAEAMLTQDQAEVKKFSLSGNEQGTALAGGYRITGEDIALAPTREDIARMEQGIATAPAARPDDIVAQNAPDNDTEELGAPTREDIAQMERDKS